MAHIEKFYTVHKPKEHSAHNLDNSILVEPVTTEVQLVAMLLTLGIDVGDYDYYDNRVDSDSLVVNWERAS